MEEDEEEAEGEEERRLTQEKSRLGLRYVDIYLSSFELGSIKTT